MIRPHSLDSETISRLRELAAATYSGRDDLYIVAEHVNDENLAIICRRLADNLAGHTAHLEQIIAMHGQDAGFKESLTSLLGEEIMRILRKGPGDQGIVSAVQQEQDKLRERYDATIAATQNPEAQSVLEQQKKDVDFAERVLRQVSPPHRADSPSGKPKRGKA